MPESKAYHPKYGQGTVLQTRHKGFELLVVFEDGLNRWVRLDELEEIGVQFAGRGLATPAPVSSDPRLKSRRMIEAFRLGIVPYNSVEDFTFGRDKETNEIVDWLISSDRSTLIVKGEYGTGKTHLLHHALGKALQNGFAVAWVEMDPNESPFHKPKRVYSHLLKNFKYYPREGGQLRGFRDFLREAIRQGAFKNHIFFKYLIEHNDEVLWEWIEGSESIPRPVEWIQSNLGYIGKYKFLPGLYDYSTAINLYCYLISSLGWAAKQVLGLQGLFLVFDEAETVSMSHYSNQKERAKEFLTALIRIANNEEILCKRPALSSLTYCLAGVGRSVPFLFKLPSGLKLLFAFTSLDWNYEMIWDGSWRKVPKIKAMDNIPRIDLEPLTVGALKEVFEHICMLYDSSYDFLVEDRIIGNIFQKVNTQDGRTRLSVKGSVEALDLVRFNPGEALDEVLQ